MEEMLATHIVTVNQVVVVDITAAVLLELEWVVEVVRDMWVVLLQQL